MPSLESSSSFDSTSVSFRDHDTGDKSNQEEAKVEPTIKQSEYLKDKRLLQDLENVLNYNQQDKDIFEESLEWVQSHFQERLCSADAAALLRRSFKTRKHNRTRKQNPL